MSDMERKPNKTDRRPKPVLKEYVPINLPKIKISVIHKLWARINGHKSTLCYIGMLAGGILTLIPYTAVFGKALFCVSFGGEGVSLIHREGKASKYGESGQFNFRNLLEALGDLIRAIVRFFTYFTRRKKS